MRHRFLTALAAALCATAAHAAPASRDFVVGPKPVMADRYPDRLSRWPNGVTSLADVTFSTITGYRPLTLDIYMPPRSKGLKPLVVYVHGGGWVGGHTRQSGAAENFPAVLARLASEGFVVASIEYRLAREASFPAQIQDVRAALRFLKANAAKYGLDPARTGIWGGSAGGHLAALAAASCGVAGLDPTGARAAPGGECVQAAAIWYGVFDFAAIAASRPGGVDGAAAGLLGCKGPCTEADFGVASPVTYVDAKDPPFLLIHGVDDKTVPVAQSRLAEARMKAAGEAVEAVYIDGVDHSFIGGTAAETKAATLLALNLTFDFFHKQLDRPGK